MAPERTPDDDPPLGYDAAHEKAESIARDPAATQTLLSRAEEKAQRVRDVRRVKGFWSDLTTLVRMIRARVKGTYPDMPWRTLVGAITAVVYFVNPVDVIPDFIPLLGYIDDAAVIAFVLRMIGGDLLRFREWEAVGDAAATPDEPQPTDEALDATRDRA